MLRSLLNKGLYGGVEHRGALAVNTHQVVVSIMAVGLHGTASLW